MIVNAAVTPEVLLWARESSGFLVEDVVYKLGQKKVTPEIIEAWEGGEKQPTYTQLEKLAGIYKRPIAIFFFPAPPEEDSIKEKFRSLPEKFAEELPPNIRYLIRKAMARQMDLYDLYEGVPPVEISNFRNKMRTIQSREARTLAMEARAITGITLKKQFTWKTSEQALKAWRNQLENMGFWIFKDTFGNDNYSGFYLPDDHFPVIYLNNNMPKNRQIFTLFHELGHFLIGKGGIDFREHYSADYWGNYKREEVFCNAFASSFLVPEQEFPISRKPTTQEIENYAGKYKVSRETILRRCLDQNLVTQDFYEQKTNEWRKQWENNTGGNTKEGGGNYHATQKVYLGDKYLKLAFRKYHQHQINEYQLADYLGLKVSSLPAFEGHVLKVGF